MAGGESSLKGGKEMFDTEDRYKIIWDLQDMNGKLRKGIEEHFNTYEQMELRYEDLSRRAWAMNVSIVQLDR